MPDEFHQHEALHTCHVIGDTFNTHVTESVYVKDNPELEELCDKAQNAIFQVYQAIGAKEG
ncbi:MAG: hypothetical protein JKY32_07225 [Rhizobiales bacterium]|nr:hypothetical protein [Hyphomicrobiales bacterium]